MNVKNVFQADRRLCILRVLQKSPKMSCNHFVLQSCLDSLGHSVSRDLVKNELTWLEEMNLVKIEDMDVLMVAQLTSKGLDVAEGRERVHGVKKPVPGE